MSTPTSTISSQTAPSRLGMSGSLPVLLMRAVGFVAERLPGLTVAILVIVVTGPLGTGFTANSHPRVALAAALVEDQTIAIDDYQQLLTVDYAVKDGTIYADKAPGASFFFAPVYAAYRAVGGASVLDDPGPVYVLAKLWLATLPAGLLALAMASVGARVTTRRAALVALMLAMGTLLLPFATLPFGHLLAASLGFGAYAILTRRPLRPVAALLGGLLAGAAVMVEYPLGAVFIGLAILVAVTERRSVIWYLVGAAPPLLALAAYDWAAFGSPLTSPYRYAVGYLGDYSGLGLAAPDFGTLLATLVGVRGLFILTPIVLVAILGFRPLSRGRQIPRSQIILIAGVVATFALLPAVWGDQTGATGGYAPGPRFFIPAVGFLVLPLAAATERWPWLALGAAAVGFVIMGLATITEPLAAQNGTAITFWLEELFSEGDIRFNSFSDVLGNVGWVVYGVIVSVAAALVAIEIVWAGRRATPA